MTWASFVGKLSSTRSLAIWAGPDGSMQITDGHHRLTWTRKAPSSVELLAFLFFAASRSQPGQS